MWETVCATCVRDPIDLMRTTPDRRYIKHTMIGCKQVVTLNWESYDEGGKTFAHAISYLVC